MFFLHSHIIRFPGAPPLYGTPWIFPSPQLAARNTRRLQHSPPAHCCRPPDRPFVRWTGRRVPTCRRGRLRTRSPWGFPWWNTVDYQVLMGKNMEQMEVVMINIEFIMGHEFPWNPQKKITMSSFPISFYAIIFPWDFHLSQVSPILWGFFHVMLPRYIEHARAAPCERLTKTFKAKDLASKKSRQRGSFGVRKNGDY